MRWVLASHNLSNLFSTFGMETASSGNSKRDKNEESIYIWQTFTTQCNWAVYDWEFCNWPITLKNLLLTTTTWSTQRHLKWNDRCVENCKHSVEVFICLTQFFNKLSKKKEPSCPLGGKLKETFLFYLCGNKSQGSAAALLHTHMCLIRQFIFFAM